MSLLCVLKRSGVFPVPAPRPIETLKTYNPGFNLQICPPTEAVSERPPYLSFQLQNDILTFALSYILTFASRVCAPTGVGAWRESSPRTLNAVLGKDPSPSPPSPTSSPNVAIYHTIAGPKPLLKLSHVLQFKNDFVFLKTIA